MATAADGDHRGPLVLGVDGGGTACSAVLARLDRDGQPIVVSRGVGGPANPRVAGFEAAQAAISSAVTAAFDAAGLRHGPVAAACLGLSGAGRDFERATMTAWAEATTLATRVRVVTDADILFSAGPAADWGIVVIAGTGSIAMGRSAGGPIERCGGWGPLMGDEGSGYWIACEGLRAAVRMADGRGPATRLLEALARRLDASTPSDLVTRVHDAAVGRHRIADLARTVVEVAASGDGPAAEIVARAADDLAALVIALARRLGFAPGCYPLRAAGGLLRNAADLRGRLIERITAVGHAPGEVVVVSDPALAAVRVACGLLVSPAGSPPGRPA